MLRGQPRLVTIARPAMSNPSSPSAATTHLLYLHGFRSSPQSFKARRLGGWLAQHHPGLHWWCPQLPPSPAEAMAMVADATSGWPRATMAVLGSSLGGFYATVVAEATGCRALVMNPAVQPARDLVRHVGEQTSYHQPEWRFEFRPGYLDELRRMTPPALTQRHRYAAIIAKGDELLDWREMATHFDGASTRLLEGSDHALSDFDDHLPFILDFLNLPKATS